MRSRSDYIVTKEEVHGYANLWLSTALRLEYEGTRCTASTLLQVLLIAAARVVSIFAACRDLADAPSDQTIRNALFSSLPEMAELERRSNVTARPPALAPDERSVWQEAHITGLPVAATLDPESGLQCVSCWPIHEPDWKREILRSEVAES